MRACLSANNPSKTKYEIMPVISNHHIYNAVSQAELEISTNTSKTLYKEFLTSEKKVTSLILIIMTIVIDIPVRYLRQSFSLLISCRFPLLSFSGQSVLYSAQIMLDVSQNAGDALHVVEDVHTLCVGIIVHLKWTGNSLGKSPANNTFVSLSLTRFFQYWITWFFFMWSVSLWDSVWLLKTFFIPCLQWFLVLYAKAGSWKQHFLLTSFCSLLPQNSLKQSRHLGL